MAKKPIDTVEIEREGDALKQTMDMLYGKLDKNELMNELLTSTEFNKSFEDKMSSLSKAGYDTEVEKLRALLLEAIMVNDLEEMVREEVTPEGDMIFERDSYGYMARILRMAARSWPARLVIDHRQRQLVKFGKKGAKDEPGFIIRKKNPDDEVSEKERQEMNEWTEKVVKSVYLYGEHDPNIGAALGASFEDTYSLNRMVFYTPLDKAGRPQCAILVDPAKIRELMPENIAKQRWQRDEYERKINQEKPEPGDDTNEEDSSDKTDESYKYVIYSGFTGKEGLRITGNRLIMGKLHYTTDSEKMFEINSPLEHSLTQITSLLSAYRYTSGQISSNATPLGMLFIGVEENSISKPALRKFQQSTWAYIKDPGKRHRLPIWSGPAGAKPQFINFLPSNRDVQYFEWMSLLVSIMGAHAGIDAGELGFANHKEIFGQKGLMKEGPEGITKISTELGRDSHIELFVNTLNSGEYVEKMTGHDDWELAVTGLKVEDKKLKIELQAKELETYKSIEQISAENDSPIDPKILKEHPWMSIPGILNPTASQLYLQTLQMNQQQQAGGGMAEAGGEGGEGGEEDYSQFLEPEDEEAINAMAPEEDQKPEGEETTPEEIQKSLDEIVIEIG